MSPAERVKAVLEHRETDQVPFTVYESMMDERQKEILYPHGLCVVDRVCSYEIIYPDGVLEESERIDEQTVRITRVYRTDCGDLRTVILRRPYTSWTEEYLFKDESDYPKLNSLVKSMRPKASYDGVVALQKALDPGFHVIRDQIPLEPLQKIILEFMGTETFCYELMDHRDEIMKLSETVREFNRKVYPIVAQSPLDFCNYGGNVMPDIIGAKIFSDIYVPDYCEAAEQMHRVGKKIGSHFDANNTVILPYFNATDLDYIEAYDLGMNKSIEEFCSVCDKMLWLNYPSAWQLHSPESIYREARDIAKDAKRTNGLLIGITEDVDRDRIVGNCLQILKAIREVE